MKENININFVEIEDPSVLPFCSTVANQEISRSDKNEEPCRVF